MSTSPPARRRSLLALAVGFGALGVALLAAHWAPATGYEISIYTATPLTYWIPVAIALVTSVYVAVTARSTWAWGGGLTCSGGAVLSVAALPILRGYYFYGTADALTHLGWTKDILAGLLRPSLMMYPGIHTYTIFVSRTTGLELSHAMLFVVWSFVTLSALFVPLTIWILTQRRWLVTAGAYAGLCYLSINQVSTHYMSAHPFTQSTQMFPLAIYAMTFYLVSRRDDAPVGKRQLTATGALFTLVLLSGVFYHPEHMVNLLIVLGFAVVAQIGGRWLLDPNHRILTQRSLLPHTAIFGVLTVAWTALHSRGRGSIAGITGEIREFLLGSGDVGGVVQQRSGSLAAIGVSFTDIFLRLFLVMGLFAALSGLLILLAGIGRARADRSDTGAVVTHLSLGLAVLVPASLLLFVGNVSKLFFRNLGSIMMLSTIVGVLALGYVPILLKGSMRGRSLLRRMRNLGPTASTLRTVAVVVLVLFLMTHSLAILFKSPYVYRPNRHVNEQMMSGHETFFEHQVEGVEIYNLRSSGKRFTHAIYGVEGSGTTLAERPTVPDDDLRSLPGRFNGTNYLVLSRFNRLTELVAYREVRFERGEFDSLDSQPGVNRVHDNGEVWAYLIRGSNSTRTGS